MTFKILTRTQMLSIAALSATVLAGTVYLPNANAADDYYHNGLYSREDRDSNRDSYRLRRYCRDLREQIRDARADGRWRRVERLRQEYDRLCRSF